MSTPHTDGTRLRQAIADVRPQQFFFDRDKRVRIAALGAGTVLGGHLGKLADRNVLLVTGNQLSAALALIELDGVAGRIVILPPDADPAHFAAIAAGAEIDAIVADSGAPDIDALDVALRVTCTDDVIPAGDLPAPVCDTEWVMLTSGTTGVAKMVVHSLAGLTAAFRGRPLEPGVVWGTFYDMRRYGGLQIFLRAVLGGCSFVLSRAGEPLADHLARLGACGVTHLLGTPTHWRRALMSPAIRRVSPRYVRLSGEIADQAILDTLSAAFPLAIVAHAYASTEAGVAFEVRDRLAGFPAELVGGARDGVEIRVRDGSLRIRSPRAAARYIGNAARLADADGFVDTGDMVELHGARYSFAGRRGGIINIGGLKVHPEEVEAVINRHPRVRMSLVRPKKSPVTGAVVAAEVVLKSDDAPPLAPNAVKDDILKFCRDELPLHKVPAAISIVPSLDVAATGKLVRRDG